MFHQDGYQKGWVDERQCDPFLLSEYPILAGKLALRVRELIRQIAAANEVEIISGAVSSDHIDIYVSIPPASHHVIP